MIGSNLGHALDDGHVDGAVVVVFVDHGLVGGATRAGTLPGGAAEVPRSHGAVGRDCHVVLAAHRNHLAFVLTVEQVVVALHARKGRPAVVARDNLQVMQLVGVHGAGAERAYLALAHQVVERFHGLFYGYVVIEAMDDVEVQVIGAEAFERTFDLSLDACGGKAPFVEVDFACEHDVLACDPQVAQRGADIFLARAEAVAIGGVDEVDAGVERALDDGASVVGPDGPLVEVGAGLAEAHAAQAEFGDFDAGMSEGCVLHGSLLVLEGMAIAYVDGRMMYIAYIDYLDIRDTND